MSVLKVVDSTFDNFREGASRRMIYTERLHMVVIDFVNGPWDEPDPYHSHVHDQVTYVETGELYFFCEGEERQRLSAGDMFAVKSDKNHTIQLLSKTARLVDCFTPLREEFL